MTIQIDTATNKPVDQDNTGGAAHVTTMPGGITHIRESITLTTSAEIFDFSATPIKAATVYCVPIATITNENISAAICVDPPSAAVATAWLTAADSLTADSQRIPVSIYFPIELVFTAPISYIGGLVDIGTTAECRLIIVGVEV